MSETTLQINLSAGDAAYAEHTVPALLAAHPDVAERLLIVDLCKPQATRIVDPARRYPDPAFSLRRDKVAALARQWLAAGQVDRVEFLQPNDPLFGRLARTYLRPWAKETHDYGGCAVMSYLAAFELCRTRWILHYDADMLLYQESGFSWAAAARAALVADPRLVAAIPRPAPPASQVDCPSLSEGLPSGDTAAGWYNAWLSTRCFFCDLERLRPLLPLLQGRLYWRVLLRKLASRGYPVAPEILLFRRLQGARRYRLVLRDRRAWLLHPNRKDEVFQRLLPRLIPAVQAGRCPDEQLGRQDLVLDSWQVFLS